MWEEGYRLGDLRGEVFADVPEAFSRWRAQGLEIGIFSSGSVLAQQLLFRYSSAGDLTGHLRWHFDTTVGPKGDAASYARIAAAMTLPPHAVLFLSDVVRELDAARAAGLQTRLVIRPGNAAVPEGHGHVVIGDLRRRDVRARYVGSRCALSESPISTPAGKYSFHRRVTVAATSGAQNSSSGKPGFNRASITTGGV